MKVAQLKTFAKHADAITVRIPDAIDSANVKAILKRAGNASGNAKAKAVAQLVLDVSRLPITPPRSSQVRTDKMWADHQVLVQLVEKAREKVRAPPRPPRALDPVLRTRPPPIARPRGPSLAGQNGRGQEEDGPRQAAQTGEFERRPPVRRADEGTCVGVGVGVGGWVCVCRSVLEWVGGCVFVAVYLSVPGLSRAHTHAHTPTHTHTYTHTHTQVIKVTDEAIICPGCKHKSMMPGLSLSALDEINRKRDLIFEQRGGNDDEDEDAPAAKRRRKNELPLSMAFICQCANQALVSVGFSAVASAGAPPGQ